jgi:hypothetical protein
VRVRFMVSLAASENRIRRPVFLCFYPEGGGLTGLVVDHSVIG